MPDITSIIQTLRSRHKRAKTKAVEAAKDVINMMNEYIRALEDDKDPHAPGVNYMSHNAVFRALGQFEETQYAVEQLERLQKEGPSVQRKRPSALDGPSFEDEAYAA